MSRRLFLQQLAGLGLGTRLTPRLATAQSAATIPTTPEKAYVARPFFYRPVGGRVGDVIPYHDGDTFRIFHLNRLDNSRSATSWFQVSTKDFVHFAEHGEMLPRGGPDQQDLSVATGSVIKHQGRYHIFYTGYNSIFRKEGKPEQGVMHAVSDDLLKWTKIPSDTFFAPQSTYERDDWRDPFVFWNEDAREYWMLVAARLKTGPARRRGCTALCTSKDLVKWETREPFWAPGLYFTHECPDLFRIGEWWYLVFSEFSERMQTRYRMSHSVKGPWHTPDNDTFDVRALYAAKTASDGTNRFLFGWNPVKTDSKDSGRWEWGGNLVAHQLIQHRDGTLAVKVPETVERVFANPVSTQFEAVIGKCELSGKRATISAVESFGAAVAGLMPERCKIEATVQFDQQVRACGLILHGSEDLDTGYYIRLEPRQNRLVLDKWRRPGDAQFMVEFERPILLRPGVPIDMKIIIDDTISEIYVANELAMSTRMYDMKQGRWGIFVEQGTAEFKGLGLFTASSS